MVRSKSVQKPSWWPENPYPESVFPMSEDEYPKIVPDPGIRTALSGMLGRRFWEMASDAIWMAMVEAIEDGYLTPAEPDPTSAA
jgi:hypothetical protein